MPSILPTKPLIATKKNPTFIVTYGMPKIGKTTMIAKLESCAILDFEDGASSFTNLRIPIKYIEGPTVMDKHRDTGEDIIVAMSLNEFKNQIMVYAKEFIAANPGKKPPYLYKRICIDTGDKFEEICIKQALIDYKRTPIGKDYEGNTILELPYGLGNYYVREQFLNNIESLRPFCETLIVNCHTRDSITSLGGLEFTAKDLALTGKLAAMTAAKADAIIYWFRNLGSKTMMGSLQTVEGGGVMGARDFPHLTSILGTKFEFSWDKILIDPATK